MAASCSARCSVRPSALLSSQRPLQSSLSSSGCLSRPAVLQAPPSRRAASHHRARVPVRVAAFQMPSNKWWLKSSPPNVVHVRSVQHLVDEMAGAGERLVIVDVFAPWCAACKALYPKLMKLMEQRPDVLLLAVNFDENKTVVKAMGVKVLPWFMFYRGKEGKLQEFSASSKKFNLIEEAIERHSTARCILSSGDEEPVLAEFPNVQPAKGVAASLDQTAGQPPPQPQPVA